MERTASFSKIGPFGILTPRLRDHDRDHDHNHHNNHDEQQGVHNARLGQPTTKFGGGRRMGPQKWSGLGRGEDSDFFDDEKDSFDDRSDNHT